MTLTSTQQGHLSYTLNEWIRSPFKDILALILNDDSVKHFVDIGGNVGGVELALTNLGLIHKLNKITIFEPDHDNFKFLTNICNNIKTQTGLNLDFVYHNIGIYYGKTECQVCGAGDGNVGGYFLADERITTTRPFNVQEYDGKTFKLDEFENYFDNNAIIDCVKIDIEGGELNLLENSHLLRNNCKYIILEWHFTENDFNEFYNKNLQQYDVIMKDVYRNQYVLKNKINLTLNNNE